VSSPEVAAQRVIGFDGSRAAVASLTGTETYSLELLRQFAGLTEPGELRVYLNAETVPETLPAGPDYRLIPLPRLWTHARLAGEMATTPPDLLFVPAHVIPPRHPKAVVTIHDVAFRTTPEVFSRLERTELDAATRWNVRAAEAIIAVSRVTRDDLIEHYGVDAGRIFVVPHGVDRRFRPSDPDAIAAVRQHFQLERPFLLAIGTLHQRKNFDGLIDAFEKVSDPLGEFDLVIAGQDGSAANDLRKRAAQSPRSGHIRFPGYIPGELLPGLLSAAELFILPSWYEGFGMPALEAMACDTPVVAASTGALPETSGGAAELVPPDDPVAMATTIEQVLGDSSRKQALIERGRNRARIFTWERTAQMTLRVLRAVRDGHALTDDSLGWLDASLMFKHRDAERNR
jgi:glycosyltransferase involved in cell wall biosynthesis